MTTFSINTLGCKVNSYESQYYREALIKEGFFPIKNKEVADIYLINTCTLTDNATTKSLKMIRRAINKNPLAFIVVVGCVPAVYLDKVKIIEGVDLIIGSAGKTEIASLIKKSYQDKNRKLQELIKTPLEYENMPIKEFNQTRAFLKIQDGCNQKCSYCIIPYARGEERSLALQEVLSIASDLARNHKEIVLSGIHTGRYGYSENINLNKLLLEMVKIKDLERLRLSSIEVNEVSQEIIDLMHKKKKLAHHLHIPLQSGSVTILKAMNRPYTPKEYLKKLHDIRLILPNISISADIIVGFPGEDEDNWLESLDFIKKCNFSFLHVFPYSARINTEASLLKNQVSVIKKKQRVKELLEFSKNQYEKYQDSFIGRNMEVLIEKSKDNYSFGHSSEYLPVTLTKEYEPNTIVKVRGQSRLSRGIEAIAYED